MKIFRALVFCVVLVSAATPASFAAIVVLSSLAQEHTLTAGENFEGQIFLRNSGTETATARITQTDYSFLADGSNDFGAPGVAARSNARWLAPTTSLLRIPAGEVAAVKYRGRAPTATTLPGSYWSVIMIEDSAVIPDTSGISTRARYAIQIVTHFGHTGTRSVRFGKRECQRNDKGESLQLDVENDGQRLVFPKVWVELFDRAGTKIGRFGGDTRRLYPECAARYQITFPALPAGNYQALILADCGDDQVVGTQCELAL